MSTTITRVTPRPGRLKQCCRCRDWQPLRRFGVERRLPDGHRNECLACRNDRRRALKQGAPRVHPWTFAKNKEKDMIKTTAIALLLLGCSSTHTNDSLFGHGDAGPDAQGGSAGLAGAAGQAGSNNPPDGAAGQGGSAGAPGPSCEHQPLIGSGDPCGPGDAPTKSCVEANKNTCYRCTNGGQKTGCTTVVNEGASASAPSSSWWCC